MYIQAGPRLAILLFIAVTLNSFHYKNSYLKANIPQSKIQYNPNPKQNLYV